MNSPLCNHGVSLCIFLFGAELQGQMPREALTQAKGLNAREPSRLCSWESERRTAREIYALPPHARIAISIVSITVLLAHDVVSGASIGHIQALGAVIIDEIGIGEHVEIVVEIERFFLLLIMLGGNDVQVGKVLGHIRCASTGEGHCRHRIVVFRAESRPE